MRRAYAALLRLYPRDFRALFASEMLIAFERTAEEHRACGRAAFARFSATEFAGLVIACGVEWVAKLTTDSSIRGRYLPDRLLMRPPGVPWDVHYGPAPATIPDELAEAQNRTDYLVNRMVHAIANHDFEGARSYSFEERKARENLRLVREKYRCSSDTWPPA